MKDEMTTNKLEYYVPESVRMLRILHLMFAHADSPDRMSILAQGDEIKKDETGTLWENGSKYSWNHSS